MCSTGQSCNWCDMYVFIYKPYYCTHLLMCFYCKKMFFLFLQQVPLGFFLDGWTNIYIHVCLPSENLNPGLIWITLNHYFSFFKPGLMNWKKDSERRERSVVFLSLFLSSSSSLEPLQRPVTSSNLNTNDRLSLHLQ